MTLFTQFFNLIIGFVADIFDELNNLAFLWEYNNNTYTIPYGWIILAGTILCIITNTFWRGGRK